MQVLHSLSGLPGNKLHLFLEVEYLFHVLLGEGQPGQGVSLPSFELTLVTILNVTRVLARTHSSLPKQPCNQAFKEKITGASHLLELREKNAGSHLIQVLPKTSQSCWCNLNRSTVANGSTEVLLMDLWNPIHRLGVISGSSRSAGNILNGWTDPRQLRESGLYSHNFLRPVRRDLQEGLHDGRVENLSQLRLGQSISGNTLCSARKPSTQSSNPIESTKYH